MFMTGSTQQKQQQQGSEPKNEKPICVLQIDYDPKRLIEDTLKDLREIAHKHDIRVRLVAIWAD